ncbi:MAG: helix-turn-helix domain-containing protein [Acidimicrobiales bacterium]
MTAQAVREPDRSGDEVEREVLEAMAPVVAALGGEIVGAGDSEPLDVPFLWRGDVVGYVRPAGLRDAFERLIERVAAELGAPLSELSRESKQRAVQLLEEHGAFTFRRSVEDAAEALQVSRFTVYNYLSRISGEKAAPGKEGRSRRPSSETD